MNQQTQSVISETSVGSKRFIDQLEANIIQIARSLSIEHSVPVDPDAKEMTRVLVQTRLNTLLKPATVTSVKELYKKTTDTLKTTKDSAIKEIATELYHILKLVDLDNV